MLLRLQAKQLLFEEAIGNSVSNLICLRFEPPTLRSRGKRVIARPTNCSVSIANETIRSTIFKLLVVENRFSLRIKVSIAYAIAVIRNFLIRLSKLVTVIRQ